MPENNITTEYGKPMSADGSAKTSTEIFDAKHGTYKETWGQAGSQNNPASSLDPSPFTITGPK